MFRQKTGPTETFVLKKSPLICIIEQRYIFLKASFRKSHLFLNFKAESSQITKSLSKYSFIQLLKTRSHFSFLRYSKMKTREQVCWLPRSLRQHLQTPWCEKGNVRSGEFLYLIHSAEQGIHKRSICTPRSCDALDWSKDSQWEASSSTFSLHLIWFRDSSPFWELTPCLLPSSSTTILGYRRVLPSK